MVNLPQVGPAIDREFVRAFVDPWIFRVDCLPATIVDEVLAEVATLFE